MKKFRHYIYQSSADFTRAMLWEAKYIPRQSGVLFVCYCSGGSLFLVHLPLFRRNATKTPYRSG